jgi:uncharacterized protein with LGFP repeats
VSAGLRTRHDGWYSSYNTVNGAIRDRWIRSSRQNGPLGYAVDEAYGAFEGSGRAQEFRNGQRVVWSPATGAVLVTYNVWQVYHLHSDQNGRL